MREEEEEGGDAEQQLEWQWHFGMLHDGARNAAFADAIAEVFAPRRTRTRKPRGSTRTCLDIGAGQASAGDRSRLSFF